MQSVRTDTLLTTRLDGGYVQSERRRIFEELAMWNETDRSKYYPSSIDEIAYVKNKFTFSFFVVK